MLMVLMLFFRMKRRCNISTFHLTHCTSGLSLQKNRRWAVIFPSSMYLWSGRIIVSLPNCIESPPSLVSIIDGTHLVLRNARLTLNLAHMAPASCSSCHLDSEIARLRDLFRQNGYPDHVVNRCIDKKLSTWPSEKVFGPKKYPVCIRLPYIGDVSFRFEGQIGKAIDRCHSTDDSTIIFESHRTLPKVQKDVIPAIHLSNVVYECACECDARFVGIIS